MSKDRTVAKIAINLLESMSQFFESEEALAFGVSTGFVDLDRITCGLNKGELVMITGRPGMGSSLLSLNIAEWIAMHNKKTVLFFSADMREEQLMMRLMSALGRIEIARLRSGQLRDEDWPRLSSAVAQLSGKKIIIVDEPLLSPDRIRQYIHDAEKAHGEIGLIVIDGLQHIRLDADNLIMAAEIYRSAELSDIMLKLKVLAKYHNTPIIVTCQLSRALEQRCDKRPILSDLLGSSAIQHHADLIISVYRDEVYDQNSPAPGTAEIIINKNRMGPTGTIRLTFLPHYCRFENFANHSNMLQGFNFGEQY